MTAVAAKKGPGRPPKVPLEQRPEFQEAVAKTAAMTLKALLENGVLPAAGAAPATSENTQTLFREMALSIAEISDQGTHRKRVAPEILAAREAAYQRTVAVLEDCHRQLKLAREAGDEAAISAWSPEYRVIAKICFNERVIEPFKVGADKQPAPNEIVWTGMPNNALMPINDIAKKIFNEYRQWVGTPSAVHSEDKRPVWITAQGLVVKGEPPARRFVAAEPDFKDDLREKGAPNDPRAPFVHVLGTVAAPARQNTVQGSNG